MKILAVCDFRLDFESFDIAPPSVTDETDNGHGCQDVMQAMVNTGSATSVSTVNTVQTFNALPAICGNNQGQHSKIVENYAKLQTCFFIFILVNNYHIYFIFILVYLDAGTLPGDTAMITFTFDSTVGTGDFSRFWDIKVTQIPCNSKYE